MLNLLDESLETFLRAEVPLSAKAVDLSFEAPDSDWGAGVTKPTVNLYLWDVRRNVEGAQSGFELVEDDTDIDRDELVAKVRDDSVKEIGYQCPGHEKCLSQTGVDCHKRCPCGAISHSW